MNIKYGFILVAIFVTALAHAAELTVTGYSEQLVAPDTYQVRFGVSVKDSAVKEVARKLYDEVSRLRQEMAKQGVDATRNVMMGEFKITEEFKEESGSKKPDGWSGVQTLLAESANFAEISDLLKAAFSSGAKAYMGIQAVLKDRPGAEQKVLQEAVTRGQGKAQVAAEAAGFKTIVLKTMHEVDDSADSVSEGKIRISKKVVMVYEAK